MENNEKNITENAQATPVGDYFEGRVLHLAKPFAFEGEIHETIDFGGLDDLTGADHINAMNIAARMNQTKGVMQPAVPQMDTNYQYAIASFATKLPFEAFAAMPYRTALLISGYVRNFMFARD